MGTSASGVVSAAVGLALLFLVLLDGLDVLALRHLTQSASGTLMAGDVDWPVVLRDIADRVAEAPAP